MARVPRLSPRFLARRRSLGVVKGAAASVAVGATIAALVREELPGPEDREGLMPPVARYWFRRVPGHNLWLWFSFDDDELEIVSLTAVPPIPLDD